MKQDEPDSKLSVSMLGENNPEIHLDRLNHYLAFSLSLSERIARALGSLIGGSTLFSGLGIRYCL